MFEKAVRMKLRFPSPVGELSTEDLFDLPLMTTRSNVASLNDTAKRVSRMLKDAGEEDFVTQKSGADEKLQLKLDLVKYVIQVKQAENAAKEQKEKLQAQKQRILELMAQKDDQELAGKSKEELEALLATM